MKAWIALNVLVLFALVVRFMQPQFIYWTRQLVVRIRLNKILVDRSLGRPVSQRDYVKLLVQDLRPEGVAGKSKLLSRVNKVRELYNMLDVRRKEVRGLWEAKNSQICTVELANLLGAIAQHLRPSEEYNNRSVQANVILHLVASSRSRVNPGFVDLPEADDEEALEKFLEEQPFTLEQINEMIIAVIYAIAYRLRITEESKARQTWLASLRVCEGIADPGSSSLRR